MGRKGGGRDGERDRDLLNRFWHFGGGADHLQENLLISRNVSIPDFSLIMALFLHFGRFITSMQLKETFIHGHGEMRSSLVC